MRSRTRSSRFVAKLIHNHHLTQLPSNRAISWRSSRLIGYRSSAIGSSLTADLPPLQSTYPASCHRRRFKSSWLQPTPQEPLEPIGSEEWENLSPEARIQLEGERKWGWVVYRCCYAKEFDARWEEIKRHILDELHKDIAKSDAPGIAKTMDFVFVEDPTLEGASVTQLQHRFQVWARASEGYHFVEGRDMSRNSRHEFFIMVDSQGLRNRTIGLVHGWPLEKVLEEVLEERDQDGAEDWIRITADYTVTTNLYEQLNDLEYWYTIYKPPEMGLACV